MGACGSTRWGGHKKKLTVEASFGIDIEKFCPHLRAKRFGRFRYESSHGGWVLVTLSPHSIEIGYVSNARRRRQRADLARGAGNRLYVRCPKCGRCARRLFLPPGGNTFACRVCHHLTHCSTQQYDKRLKEYRLFFKSWRQRARPRITVEAIGAAIPQAIP